MNTIHDQLPLVFETRNAFSFDTLVTGDNELAIGIVRQCAHAGPGQAVEKQVLVWADSGCGKSHLLQACCQLGSQSERTVCYLPAREIRDYSPAVLEGLERLDLLCIDDIDALLGDATWEEALFDLINRSREQRQSLILSAHSSPEHAAIGLPDLRSRLAWGPVFHLRPLSDERKVIALQLRASQRGIMLESKVAEYMLNHYSRDMFALFERLDHLDLASLAQQRKITIPFIKTIFDHS